MRIGIDEGLKISDEIKKTLETLRHPLSHLDLQKATKKLNDSDEFQSFITDAYDYEKIGDLQYQMANYWLSLMEMVEILMMNIYSLKTQN